MRADALAGLTVAILALPLSTAIAIASGASPAQGLYAAIVGGFLISALGGSRFQIGGPAVLLTGTNHDVRQELFVHGVKPPLVRYERSIETALTKLRKSVPARAHGDRGTAAGDVDASPAQDGT